MKTIEEVNVVNKNYDPIVEGVLRSWNNRKGAAVFDARLPEQMADLADLYEANLPYEGLGDGSCRTCRDFVSTYGALVYHKEDGTPVAALWNEEEVEPRYKPLFAIMSKAVIEIYNIPSIQLASKISLAQDAGALPFTADYWRAGVKERGRFHHLYIDFGDEQSYVGGAERGRLHDSIQFILWFLSDCKRLPRLERMIAYAKVTDSLVDDTSLINALANMKSIMAFWKEPADVEYLKERNHKALAFARGVAHLVHGYTKQLRGGAASVFFTDIGDPATIPERDLLRYLEMTSPANHKRVTREFNQRALELAEKKIIESGLDQTLIRRSVEKGDDLPYIWKGKVKEKAKLQILSELNVKGENRELPKEYLNKKVSWESFLQKYAHAMDKISLLVPYRGLFTGVITAVFKDAPNITLWNNPMTAWTYLNGSKAESWNLVSGTLVDVTGIMRSPEHSAHEDWSPRFTPRYLLALSDGHHEGKTVNGLFKDYYSKEKFDYDNLANFLAALAEKEDITSDENSMVFYPVTPKHPEVILYGKLDGADVRFEIISWE